MIIIFEGIDNSGKSTLSNSFGHYINNDFRSEDGALKVDPHLGDFIWTKEPTFTTEEADELNSSACTDQFSRERLFFESRLRHQDLIAGRNIICDRYIWSGIAYAKKFSPECFGFAKELYLSENLFIQPDLYVFVDTPVVVCHERDTSVGMDRLMSLRQAYIETEQHIKVPIIQMQAVDGEEEALKVLINKFEWHVSHYNLSVEDSEW